MLTNLILMCVSLLLGWFVMAKYFGLILDKIIESYGDRGFFVGPWKTHLGVGRSSIKKIEKAAIARVGLGANDSEETIYWNAFKDSDGNELNSINNYKIIFNKDISIDYLNKGFWSITVYGNDKFFVPNEEKKYSLKTVVPGNLSPIVLSRINLMKDEQWLPLPKTDEKFSLALRCYVPLLKMKKGQMDAYDLPIISRL